MKKREESRRRNSARAIRPDSTQLSSKDPDFFSSLGFSSDEGSNVKGLRKSRRRTLDVVREEKKEMEIVGVIRTKAGEKEEKRP